MDGFLLLSGQLFCLLVTAAGWGTGIWLIAGRPAPLRRSAWLWCGLAGWCAHALLLQGLVYLDVPLHRTARPAFGIAVLGVAWAAWAAWRRGIPATLPARREARFLVAVLGLGLAGASAGILAVGPADFFGKGRYDQANYVATAQFLADEPFSTSVAEIGLRPWLARPIERKEQRITQSVAHGALAAVCGTDSQRTYAAFTIFLTALTAVATARWLRAFAVPRGLAGIAGLGAALGPAVTGLQLDGYLSQLSTLFLLPALAALLTPRRRLDMLERITAAVLLAFWIGAYTEVVVVGVALVLTTRLTAGGPWKDRWAEVAWIFSGSLLANPGYTMRVPVFLADQLSLARNPELMAPLFPESGTWLGWGRLFVDLKADVAVVAAGGAMLVAMAAAVALLPRRRRSRLIAILAAPVALLGWLLLQPVLAKYPFGKLSAGFAPLWVGAAVLGVVAFSRRHFVARAGFAVLALGTGIVCGFRLYDPIVRQEGILAGLNSPAMHLLRASLSQPDERSYLIAADHPLVAQWLAYCARLQKVYVDRRNLGDRIVPSENYAFRRLPMPTETLWWADLQRHGEVKEFFPACRIRVTGAVEEGVGANSRYYVMHDSLQLEIERPPTTPPRQHLWLDFVCLPLGDAGPAELELTGSGQPRQRAQVPGPRALRFQLALTPGKNSVTLSVTPPGKPGRSLILQSLSLDPQTSVVLFNDPPAAEILP